MWFLGGGGGHHHHHHRHKEGDSDTGSLDLNNSGFLSNSSSHGSNKKQKQQQRPRRKFGRKSRSAANVSKSTQSQNTPPIDSVFDLRETYSGIEVSLPHNEMVQPTTNSSLLSSTAASSYRSSRNQVISVQLQRATLRKVYKAQFNVSKWPFAGLSGSGNASTSNELNLHTVPAFQSRNHRIPLFCEEKEGNHCLLYEDLYYLLENQSVVDEETLVSQELERMETELAAIEADRSDVIQILEKQHRLNGDAEANTVFSDPNLNNSNNKLQWDVQQQLAIPGRKSRDSSTTVLSKKGRQQLQEQRGLNLTFIISNPKEFESLLTKCGSKESFQTIWKRIGSVMSTTPLSLGPHNCREGGAAATIQHISLIPSPRQSQQQPSRQEQCCSTFESQILGLFLSRDSGKSYASHLPDRLYRRLQDQTKQNQLGTNILNETHRAHNILYLSSGPLDSYYVEFRSGECWWGCPDTDFDKICRDWDVHRVSFGMTRIVSDHCCHLSWLIVSRDGRAAWKNLPSRLHNQLSSRVAGESAIVECCLGASDSYFVRWMDGTTDWQLPASMASVCERLEKHGNTITAMSLHPELAQDFVIRHRTVQQSRLM